MRRTMAGYVWAAVCLTGAGLAWGEARDDKSPWGMGTSAEWSGDYPKFNPMLRDAGIKWLRLFPEWHGNEPQRGQFDWTRADQILENAKANGLRITGAWCYFAPWASADGGTRKGPIKDMRMWREYVAASVTRYQKDIVYWEVWNEFNGSFYQGPNKPKEYADLVVAAYETVKAIDPAIKIGLSVANFDVNFLDMTIKAGAAGHFDYICVHPYENLGAVAENGEVGYLSLTGNLRDMLKANGQREDIPLWITEVGYSAPIKPDPARDAKQAEMVVKGFLLSLAQGFQRVFWFEARGPSYGHGTDLGIIRADWSKRPAYDAVAVMTRLLGPEPAYTGWLDIGSGGYGFVFQGAAGPVLAAWAPAGKTCKAVFASETRVTDIKGREAKLAAGQEVPLAQAPVFFSDLPEAVVRQAKANLGKPYPWGGDYAHAQSVGCVLGAVNREDGVKQINPKTTKVVNGLTDSFRRTDFSVGGEGHYVYFRVDPLFVPYGTTGLSVTVVAKRSEAGKKAGMGLSYESQKGYHNTPGWWTIPEDDQWHEYTWTLTDANFVGQWGWNFRLDGAGSPAPFDVREIRVKKSAP